MTEGELVWKDAVEIGDGLEGIDHDRRGVGSDDAGLARAAFCGVGGEVSGGESIGLPLKPATDEAEDAGEDDEDEDGEDEIIAQRELAME